MKRKITVLSNGIGMVQRNDCQETFREYDEDDDLTVEQAAALRDHEFLVTYKCLVNMEIENFGERIRQGYQDLASGVDDFLVLQQTYCPWILATCNYTGQTVAEVVAETAVLADEDVIGWRDDNQQQPDSEWFWYAVGNNRVGISK